MHNCLKFLYKLGFPKLEFLYKFLIRKILRKTLFNAYVMALCFNIY